MDRREFVSRTALVAASGALAPADVLSKPADARPRRPSGGAGLKHSVCKWCYPDMTVDELAAAAASIGLQSVELLGPEDWPVVQRHGLTCAMANGPMTIEIGFNRKENHEWLVPDYEERIAAAAAAGLEKVICFSGNRDGLGDDAGLENCAEGVKALMPAAQRHGITICMELLNSRVNHFDYQCDHTEWGVALVDRVASDHFKLLYDIYHMQIMEGDIIRTIRTYHEHIAHYHTGGNPGRNEIDETQELNYRAIAEAIVETGFDGFMAQEFIPNNDPVTSLREAYEICRV